MKKRRARRSHSLHDIAEKHSSTQRRRQRPSIFLTIFSNTAALTLLLPSLYSASGANRLRQQKCEGANHKLSSPQPRPILRRIPRLPVPCASAPRAGLILTGRATSI